MERIGIYEWTIVLLGMGTVFVALIGLSLILGVFSLVAKTREKNAARDSLVTATPETEAVAASESATGVSPELVAVLTAAVAAASGRPASEIRILQASPSLPGISGLNTPVWGYANRLASSGR